MKDQTKRIRAMLDERAVEYTKRDGMKATSITHITHWCVDGVDAEFAEQFGGGTRLSATGLAPEQAIAATLGNRECEYVIEDNMNESEGMGDVWFRCTNCDTCYDYQADDWLLKMPYCPKCGATVKGVR